MLVSAISTTHNINTNMVNYGFVNSRGGDNVVENSYVTAPKSFVSAKDDADTYKSINEWKSFCHKQIEGGKLDIIA